MAEARNEKREETAFYQMTLKYYPTAIYRKDGSLLCEVAGGGCEAVDSANAKFICDSLNEVERLRALELVREAKIAALKEANKQLAIELRRTEVKLSLLVDKIGHDKIKKTLDAASFEEAAEALLKFAEDARREGAQGE